MPGIYNVEPSPGGLLRLADNRGNVALYSPDGTHRAGHRFGWFTVSVVRTQFLLHQQTRIVIGP